MATSRVPGQVARHTWLLPFTSGEERSIRGAASCGPSGPCRQALPAQPNLAQLDRLVGERPEDLMRAC